MLNDKDFTKIPLEVATTPIDGSIVYKDRYWIVVDGCILLYRGVSPQCNKDRRVVEKGLQKLYPGSEVVYLNTAYLDIADKLFY